MNRFDGECVEGPLAGRHLTHWSKSKKFYRPMVAFSIFIENVPVEAIEIGEYQLNDFGQWHWWETEAGRAFKTLFGAAA